MPDYFTLTCPSCGGRLQITNDMDRFACGNCGNELVVKRGGGTISLSPVVEELKGVRTGVDKTASELAITRLKIEIEDLYSQREIGKPSILNIIIIFLLCIFLFISIISFIHSSLFYSGFIVVLVAAGVWYFLKKNKSYKKKRDSLEKKIMEKKKELRWHQGIVKGQIPEK
jgi:hypothetical protein